MGPEAEARPATPRFFCYRCGNVWRDEGKPSRTCPRCGSSRWDVPVRKEAACPKCGTTWTRAGFDDACPNCGGAASPDILRCNQCDHEWVRRTEGPPDRCPVCHSSRWSEPRLHQYTCFRCGHVWRNRSSKPRKCPSCQSRLWNEPAYRLQCRRCGYRWVSRRPSEEVSMCPSCKSRRWNEAPVISVCDSCGEFFMSRSGRKARRCPTCVANKGAAKSECPFCGMKWTGPAEWATCPRCGKSRPDDLSDKAIEIWSDGARSLRYVFSDACAFVYLWEDGIPVASIYFHELLNRLEVNANQAMLRFGDPDYASSWKSLADHMHDHMDDYLDNVTYFTRRLSLSEHDARILAIHFTGMGPEAISLRFGMPLEDVRRSFDRIMDAYVDSGIVVDDSIFTDDPISKYRSGQGMLT